MIFEIVEANDQLLGKIASLINESYWYQQQQFFIDTPFSRERINEKTLSQIFQNPEQKIIVLRDDRILLGVIAFALPEGLEAKILLFAINQQYQGRRIGQILLDFAEKKVVECGKQCMKLEVLVFAKKLIAYYETLGYTLTGNSASFFHESCIKAEYQTPNKIYLLEMSKNF